MHCDVSNVDIFKFSQYELISIVIYVKEPKCDRVFAIDSDDDGDEKPISYKRCF